jgi:hypothetical protein
MDGQTAQALIRIGQERTRREAQSWKRYKRWYKADDPNGTDDQWPSGSGHSGELEELTLETNYPYAFVDTMVANVCPPNPQITIHPKKDELKDAAFARENLVNSVFRTAKLHRKCWEAATRAGVFGRGFLKTTWSMKKQRPVVQKIDPQYIFFDQDAEEWEDISWLIEVVTVKKSDFEAKMKKKTKGLRYNKNVVEKMDFSGYPQWLVDMSASDHETQTDAKSAFKWTTIYEVYDFVEGSYAQYVDGVEEPLMKQDSYPYAYVDNPYDMLVFNDNLEDLAGLSDVKLIARLQERLNELDTLELQHIQASIPALVFNSALVDDPERALVALENSSHPGAVLRISGLDRAPLRDIIGETPTPQINPSWANLRDRVVQQIEFILGLPQYQRGVVGVADVATEVALADTATRTRNGRRVKMVQDLAASIGMKVVALYEEFLAQDEKLRVRIHESTRAVLMNREALGFPGSGEEAKHSSQQWYEYEATAYSPTENHKVNMLHQIRDYAPLLQGSPYVDQVKLVQKLLRLLDMPQAFMEPQQMPPGQGVPGGPEGTIDPQTGLPVESIMGATAEGTGMLPAGGPIAGDAGAVPQALSGTVPGTPILSGPTKPADVLQN